MVMFIDESSFQEVLIRGVHSMYMCEHRSTHHHWVVDAPVPESQPQVIQPHPPFGERQAHHLIWNQLAGTGERTHSNYLNTIQHRYCTPYNISTVPHTTSVLYPIIHCYALDVCICFALSLSLTRCSLSLLMSEKESSLEREDASHLSSSASPRCSCIGPEKEVHVHNTAHNYTHCSFIYTSTCVVLLCVWLCLRLPSFCISH